MTTDPSGAERRGQERLRFISDCTVDIKAPAWTRVPEPLAARTQNITEHGVQVVLPDFALQRFERWQKHIESGEYVSVLIRLTRGEIDLELNGQVVWLDYQGGGDTASGECYAGVLLSLLSIEANAALRKLISHLRRGEETGFPSDP